MSRKADWKRIDATRPEAKHGLGLPGCTSENRRGAVRGLAKDHLGGKGLGPPTKLSKEWWKQRKGTRLVTEKGEREKANVATHELGVPRGGGGRSNVSSKK